MIDEQNPFASPLVTELVPAQGRVQETQAETIRRGHLKHETSVKSIGILYYLGGGLMVVGAIGIGIAGLGQLGRHQEGTQFLLFLAPIYAAFGSGFLAVGYGLRRLLGWVKWPVGILATIGLLGFPLGTLINAYILYLVFCGKGKVVLSPEYQEIIRQTPHIKYRTSLIAWIVLFVFIALLVAAIALPMLMER